MRKLLVTTALISAAFVPAASAEMDVKVGGYTRFQAAAFDNDSATNSGRDFQSEAEIVIKADGKADNGLSYGALIELQTSTSDSIASDEANIYIAGDFGRVELGDQDGASHLSVYGPYVGAGQVFGSYMDYVIAADRGYGLVEGPGDSSLRAIDSNDATKITYYTPVFSGFQAGISYAPERDSSADGEGVQFSDATGNHDNMMEIGLKYKGEISGVGVTVGGTYNMADAKDGSGLEDISAWTLGTQLAYQGFTVGGGYTDNGDSGQTAGAADDDVTAINLGATYEQGAWGVGVSYAQVDFDDAAAPFGVAGVTGSGGDYTAYGAGAVYKLVPGMTVAADLVFYDRDRVTGADTDGYVAMTEVNLAF